MNQNRRKSLHVVIELLHQSETIIERVYDEERDSLDNMPENLQNGDRYLAMSDAVDYLEDAIENVQSAAKNIDDAISFR